MIVNYRERVAGNIRYYRKVNNLTMKEVAKKVGVTEATMQKYETGGIKTLDIEMLGKIADAIGITIKQLTGYQSGEEEHEAHLERIQKRETKWFATYRDLSFEKQKAINNIMQTMAHGNDESAKDIQDLFKKFAYISPEARERVMRQLNGEYDDERKKQEATSAS